MDAEIGDIGYFKEGLWVASGSRNYYTTGVEITDEGTEFDAMRKRGFKYYERKGQCHGRPRCSDFVRMFDSKLTNSMKRREIGVGVSLRYRCGGTSKRLGASFTPTDMCRTFALRAPGAWPPGRVYKVTAQDLALVPLTQNLALPVPRGLELLPLLCQAQE